MANTSAIFGARLVGHLYGSPYNARVRQYVVDSGDGTALFLGDFVKMTGSSVVNELGLMLPIVTAAAAGNVLTGVVVAFQTNANDLTKVYRPASTLRTVWVCDDPNAIFEIQSSAATDGSEFGANADILYATGNTIFATSGTQLNYGSVSPTDGQLRILGMPQRPDNQVGLYCKLLCMINEHIFKQIAGV
jgi:hypothetical protein